MAGRFYDPPPWRSIVTNLAGATLVFLDRVALSRAVYYEINKSAYATFDAPSDNPLVNLAPGSGDENPNVSSNDRLLYMFRRDGVAPNFWTPRFAGILQQPNDEITVATDAPVTHVSAYDPWTYLNSQPVLNADGETPGKNGLSFDNVPGSVIVVELLNNLRAYNAALDAATPFPPAALEAFLNWGQSNFLGDTYAGVNPFYSGNIYDMGGDVIPTTPVSINFPQGTMLGAALTQLTAMGALDIILQPIYDPGSGDDPEQPGILCQVNIYQLAGSKRYDAVFSWDKPGRSLVGVNRLLDGQQTANIVQGFAGAGGLPVFVGPDGVTPLAFLDVPSVRQFGPYWDQTAYPSLAASPLVVQQILIAQLLLRRMGKLSLTVDVMPELAPSPFNAYFLGDQVPVYASSNFRAPLGPLLAGASVQAANPATVPLVVVTGVNDSFFYNGVSYQMVAGTYLTIAEVAAAMQAAYGVPPLSEVATVTYDSTGTYLILTSTVWFSDGDELDPGVDDVLADLGFDSGQTVEGEDLGGMQRVYAIPIQIPDDAPETVTQLLMTIPDQFTS